MATLHTHTYTRMQIRAPHLPMEQITHLESTHNKLPSAYWFFNETNCNFIWVCDVHTMHRRIVFSNRRSCNKCSNNRVVMTDEACDMHKNQKRNCSLGKSFQQNSFSICPMSLPMHPITDRKLLSVSAGRVGGAIHSLLNDINDSVCEFDIEKENKNQNHSRTIFTCQMNANIRLRYAFIWHTNQNKWLLSLTQLLEFVPNIQLKLKSMLHHSEWAKLLREKWNGYELRSKFFRASSCMRLRMPFSTLN